MSRRFLNGRGLVAAMEGEDNPTPAEDQTLPDEAPAETPEADLAEINTDEAEGEVTDAKVEEAVDAVEALESMYIALESAKERGGLTSGEAYFLNGHLQYIRKQMGYEAPQLRMESFDAPSTKMRATTIAMEGIKEELSRIWEAIKSAIKKSIEWVVNQFNKYFGAAEKLKKRAQALAKAAGETSGVVKEKDFENERIYKALMINGQVNGVPAAVANMKGVADTVYGPIIAMAEEGAASVIEALETIDLSKLGSHLQQLPGFKNVSDADAKSHGYGEAVGGLELATCGEMMGNKTILLRREKPGLTGEEHVEALMKESAQLIAFNASAKDPSNFKLKTLSLADVEAIAKSAEGVCDELIRYKTKFMKVRDLKNGLIKGIDKAEKAATDDSDKAKAADAKKLARLTQAAANGLDRPAPQFSAYALNVLAAALQYGDLSLRQYGEKAK